MSAVFSHGRLRLYLLKLLAEGPKHGYELIRLLEDRFQGRYAPSAGTVYPRLQRLETDGLVTHTAGGGRKVYEITEAGRAELRDRAGELSALESDILAAVADLVELAGEVHGSVREFRRGLRDASAAWRRGPAAPPRRSVPAAELDRRVGEFVAEVRALTGGVPVDERMVRAVGRALDAALTELRRALRE